MFTIVAYLQGVLNDNVEVDGCEAAWDRYQYYRMAFPMARVEMIDNRTNEVIATNERG